MNCEEIIASCTEKLDLGKKTGEPVRYIGINFSKNTPVAVKCYKAFGFRESASVNTGRSEDSSDYICVKELFGEELKRSIRTYIEGAAKETAPLIVDEILRALEIALAESFEKNPLFDLGCMRDENGRLKMIKYYLHIRKTAPGTPADVTGTVKKLLQVLSDPSPSKEHGNAKGSSDLTDDPEFEAFRTRAEALEKAGYYASLFGVNRFLDGRRELKQYFDAGPAANLDLGPVRTVLKTLDAVRIEWEDSEIILSTLAELGFYARGTALDPVNSTAFRLYFDRLKR